MGVRPTRIFLPRELTAIESAPGVETGDDIDWDTSPVGSSVSARDVWKQPVRAATTANITIATALNNADTLDGVTLATGDRVLVKNQGTPSQNGIYVVGTTPARAPDMDDDDEVLGSVVYVIDGTANGGTAWRVTNTAAIVLDTDALDWDSFGGGVGSLALDDLTDVDAPTPTDGDVLTWDDVAGEWVAAASAAGGSVATDAIWDAAGDLAVGTGANTAAKLALGANGHVLTSNGTTATWAAPTGGSGGLYPLDDITLDGTYGDDFDGPTLDAKWTRRARQTGFGELFTNSWMKILPVNAAHFGDTQSFTDASEFDITMAASILDQTDDGFGIIVCNSSGTGIWLGHRATSRMGFFTVTTFTTATEPVSGQSLGHAGSQVIGYGRKTWFRVQKRPCLGTATYFFSYSLDGVTWTWPIIGYQPASFTPQLIGWYAGVQAAGASPVWRQPAIDWFNASTKSIGNNLCTTPSSGTLTWTTDATSPTGTLANISNGSVGDENYFPNTNAAGVSFTGTWSVAQTINRVRIHFRTDLWGTGYVETSDGTKTAFNGVVAGWINIDLPAPVSTTYIKIVWTKHNNGANPGLREVEAYLAS